MTVLADSKDRKWRQAGSLNLSAEAKGSSLGVIDCERAADICSEFWDNILQAWDDSRGKA